MTKQTTIVVIGALRVKCNLLHEITLNNVMHYSSITITSFKFKVVAVIHIMDSLHCQCFPFNFTDLKFAHLSVV